jgi:protein required for attachment to host cells
MSIKIAKSSATQGRFEIVAPARLGPNAAFARSPHATISKEIGMRIPKGAIVAVADGEILNLFRNAGEESAPELTALPDAKVDAANKGSGGRHHSSSANPSDSQQDEDGFAAGTAKILNKRVLDGDIDNLIVVAAPRTLGELRKHYHKTLSAILVGEIAKDLTGHSVADVAKTIAAA